MSTTEKKNMILSILSQEKQMDIHPLSQRIGTSPWNTRRYLRELEQDGKIIRRHGKAIYCKPSITIPIDQGGELDEETLDRLSNRAVRVIEDAENIFISSGLVCTEVAAKITEKTITTNDLKVAMAAARNPKNEVYVVGERLHSKTLSLSLRNGEKELEDFRFHLILFEADAVDAESIMLTPVKYEILKAARARTTATAVIAKSCTFGKNAPRAFSSPGGIDVLVTDAKLPADLEAAFAGVEVEVSTEEDASYAYVSSVPDNVTRMSDALWAPKTDKRKKNPTDAGEV
jgi:DeoR/GlpR family transcriptional regulator of sugar metabolism